jgi:hypothetical protein
VTGITTSFHRIANRCEALGKAVDDKMCSKLLSSVILLAGRGVIVELRDSTNPSCGCTWATGRSVSVEENVGGWRSLPFRKASEESQLQQHISNRTPGKHRSIVVDLLLFLTACKKREMIRTVQHHGHTHTHRFFFIRRQHINMIIIIYWLMSLRRHQVDGLGRYLNLIFRAFLSLFLTCLPSTKHQTLKEEDLACQLSQP